MKLRTSVFRCAALLAALLLSTGCATTAMKGTPFFTGDYEKSQGPAEDRVNLWPAMYYREPALSALWPFIEYVDGEHFAVRPFYSVYNLGKPEGHEYNVLWPIFQQNNADKTGRLIPFFWGSRYVVGFPLYWRFGRGDSFSDTFFPLWFYNRDKGHYSLHLLLGLTGFWHEQNEDGNKLLPLWYWNSEAGGSTFLSLPWCDVREANGDGWRMAFPFFLSQREQGRSSFITLAGGKISSPNSDGWVIPLLLSAGSHNANGGDAWLLAGLAHWGSRGSNTSSHVIPFYYSARNETGSRFFSLPWWSSQQPDGTSWQLAPPLYFHHENRAGSRTLTPLFAAGSTKEDDASWQALFPFYYLEKSRDSRLLATLLGGYSTEQDGHTWMLYPLLTWNRSRGTTNDFWALAPLAHFYRDPTNSISHIVPLYYRNEAAGSFVSLPYATWRSGSATNAVIPPLLAWQRSQGQRADLWLLAGLARYSWGAQAGSSYLVPLFYGSPSAGEFMSPLYCRWEDSEGTTAAIPPLLGAYTSTKAGTHDLWGLAGLYHHEWSDTAALADHLLPLYAWSASNYFYTLLAGWQNDGRDQFRYYLTPLIGSSRHDDQESLWFFPFYGRTTYTNTGDVHGHVLWGGFHHDSQSSGSSFFPLYGYKNYGPKDATPPADGNWVQRGTDFLCLPFCWRTDLERSYVNRQDKTSRVVKQAEFSHGAFPLWSYSSKHDNEGRSETSTRLLLMLYASRHQVMPLASAPGGTNDYVKHSILWRAWHYERLNGDVTADLFPFITYDARKDGFRKHSFLWRLYRWERDAQGRRKLDLLFLPILRDT